MKRRVLQVERYLLHVWKSTARLATRATTRVTGVAGQATHVAGRETGAAGIVSRSVGKATGAVGQTRRAAGRATNDAGKVLALQEQHSLQVERYVLQVGHIAIAVANQWCR